MQNRSTAAGIRQRAIVAIIVALVVALAIPAMSFAATRLTIKVSKASVYTNQASTISGSVKPTAAKKTVVVQYKKTTSLVWKSVKVKTNSKSAWKYSFKTGTTGSYDFRAKYAKATSAKKRVTVNPRTVVMLASTTSTQDSGLMTVLEPAFEKAYPMYDIQGLYVGSGQAIAYGKSKDADVLLVHSPADEIAFVKGGWGKNRQPVMHNTFMLVGPNADPGSIATQGSIIDCFKKLRTDSKEIFVSRGDDSGTHKKELALWKDAGYAGYPNPSDWYVKSGLGMGDCLRMASEKNGYTLVDRATWVTNRPSDLKIVQQGDASLQNPYTVIEVVGAKQPAGGAAFSTWIRTETVQNTIYNFGYKKYGLHIFWPDAD
ncbi:MAG TPA: substrate-binding domain-containing protein [Coriobacteriia bacterium]|nr:substrate-binding domain-containing protein [Coriobacteriia bacterium]